MTFSEADFLVETGSSRSLPAPLWATMAFLAGNWPGERGGGQRRASTVGPLRMKRSIVTVLASSLLSSGAQHFFVGRWIYSDTVVAPQGVASSGEYDALLALY